MLLVLSQSGLPLEGLIFHYRPQSAPSVVLTKMNEFTLPVS